MSTAPLLSLATLPAADVYKAGRHAATLIRDTDGITFAYTADYLAAPGPAVATTLPVTREPKRTPAGAVPPFFAGLLPEGRRLLALVRAVKTSADDELSLLMAVGRDAVGDVQVVPAGEVPTPAEPLVVVKKDWSEVLFADVLGQGGVDVVGLPGVQDKASAGMISVPVGRRGERYILKIDPPEYPHVVENEAFFLALARQAGIDSAHAQIVHDQDGRAGLLVRRFDRVPHADGSTHAVACEDAGQVLGRWPADKYAVTSEEVVIALADRCPARAVALLRLFEQLCFAWLTGNGDVHAKNLSILERDGEWRVSPAYDLPSTVPYRDTTLALSIAGKRQGLSRRSLLAFAQEVGLPDRAAVKALDGVLASTGELEARLRGGALPFDQKTNADLAAQLRHRRRVVAGVS